MTAMNAERRGGRPVRPWRAWVPMVLALLVLAALAGCLPPAEETLGTAPPGPYAIVYTFDGGTISSDFSMVTAPLIWQPELQPACPDNLSPCIISSAVPEGSVACLSITPTKGTNYARFKYADSTCGGCGRGELYVNGGQVGAVVGSGSFTDSGPISFPLASNTISWCHRSLPGGGTHGGHLDDLEIGAQ